MRIPKHYVLVTLFCFACLQKTGHGNSNAAASVQVASAGNATFNKLVARTIDGKLSLFVRAADGAIYKFAADLSVTDRQAIRTAEECPESSCPAVHDDNLFVVDDKRDSIVTFRSASRGTFAARQLANLSDVRTLELNPKVVDGFFDLKASALVFVAPEPGNPPNLRAIDVGVVAAAATDSERPDDDGAFEPNITYRGRIGDAEIFLNSFDRNGRLTTNYVYGFSYKESNYFLTTKTRGGGTSHASNVVVTRADDYQLRSPYTAIPLTCDGEGRSYDLLRAAHVAKIGTNLIEEFGIGETGYVLFAAFSSGDTGRSETGPGESGSALCLFLLDSIENCNASAPTITAVAVKTFNTSITAVMAVPFNAFTVVFVGTGSGHVQKIVVDNSETFTEYENTVVDKNSPINPRLIYAPGPQYLLYGMTANTVFKMDILDCSVRSTCLDCAKNPFCGWCSLDDRCRTKSIDCKSKEFWVTYGKNKCIALSSVSPNRIQKTAASALTMVVDNLPPSITILHCVFDVFGEMLDTGAAVKKGDGGKFVCQTPRPERLRAIQHSLTAKMFVRSETGANVASADFTFYDCGSYASCTRCVGSSFPCTWCLADDRCTHDARADCRPAGRRCPSIRGPVGSAGAEILIANGTNRTVEFDVDVTDPWVAGSEFRCRFDVDNRVALVAARLENSVTVRCDGAEFRYGARSPNVSVAFNVTWNGSHCLDNPRDVRVVVYDCGAMAEDCSACLTLPRAYGCGWCGARKRCDVAARCGRADGRWLNGNDTCEDIEITGFSAARGPWDGRADVTIVGRNLGRGFADISDGVTVAGVRCAPYERSYEFSRKIVCRVADGRRDRTGPVAVRVNGFSGESRENYTFVDPVITGVSPSCGPISNRTFRVFGKFLGVGARVRVYFGRSLLCADDVIGDLDETHIACTAARASGGGDGDVTSGKIRVTIDESERIFDQEIRYYAEDPRVESAVSGTASPGRDLKGIVSGGIKVAVTGKHFECVRRPRMFVHYVGEKYFGDCAVLDSSNAICDSPGLTTRVNDVVVHGKPLELDYGFEMENVFGVREIQTTQTGFSKFNLFPDPYYSRFENGFKILNDKTLILHGNYLNEICRNTDVTVEIGTEHCNITTLTDELLVCNLPDNRTSARNNSNNARYHAAVNVVIGPRYRVHIGNISYTDYSSVQSNNVFFYKVLVACVIIVILVVLVVFFILYRRKSNESNDMLKYMQKQQDILELQMAVECKVVFAEFQTEITEIASDLNFSGIPFLDYHTYTMKILFPDMENTGIPRRENVQIDDDGNGIALFRDLLLNKTFLLLFIKTLESNRYFLMRDRVNVASMLMLVLRGRLGYCTDILKCLLADLIKRRVDNNDHLKLLLRRTESVAEKMLSSWFSFLLHDFLKECAGGPLYLLFRALKQQVDKGPVDAITSESRYSLSEGNLIRQPVDFVPMTVFVSITQQQISVDDVFDLCTENVPVKVLDCDTISQAKEKALDTIYRVTPCSQRPRACELDVEWITGATCRLLLYDQDSSSAAENGWKKLNTLRHYMVPDGASLNLVSVKLMSTNYGAGPSGAPTCDYGTLNLKLKYNCDDRTKSTSAALADDDDDDGRGKRWHLVKKYESEAQKNGDNKIIAEIYLTRLMSTKMPLQRFVDDLFERIFTAAPGDGALALTRPVKYMFDFLDGQAARHDIADADVARTWKSNSLPLRFWVNLIKNPDFLFDVRKTSVVDTCLSVVAQILMESCSSSGHRLGKDSPSSKLLYAKEIPAYRALVDRYYADIKNMPPVSDGDMEAALAEASAKHREPAAPDADGALHELYAYAAEYAEQLMVTLEEDESSRKQRLPHGLAQVHVNMRTK